MHRNLDLALLNGIKALKGKEEWQRRKNENSPSEGFNLKTRPKPPTFLQRYLFCLKYK